ncbi:SIMPL domain-containing protein [Thiosulfativibrio zosterae]|uniref:SIMPL domain-containing protein n=1 Tax=Thiosulfativibrio zosterae TaxID=2675053 RepID=A0A6F8PKJ3_9GAMM|nr:SIMPL domain-containing protein [Thiosulfativibrio zosterae]BBP42622.1 hypothetical protein THMIRHAT_03680 [Thiosulfativibrio zosterae]
MTFSRFCLLLICVFSMNAHAFETNQRNENRVSFSVTESAYFNNDQVTLTFRAYSQDLNPQVVANEINTQMQAAYAVLKRAPQIKVETSDYQIQPIYDKNQALTTWRGQQTLTLNMENQPGLVKIMAQIQPYLRYQNMEFGVSSAQRQLFIDDLTRKALDTFQKKAQLIAQGFQTQVYKIIETNIQSPHFPSPYLARNMMASDAVGNAPVMQAGQSQLSVTINGTLLLPN